MLYNIFEFIGDEANRADPRTPTAFSALQAHPELNLSTKLIDHFRKDHISFRGYIRIRRAIRRQMPPV